MPVLVQVCIAIATLTLVVIGMSLMRAMSKVSDTAERVSRLTDAAQIAIAQLDQTSREAHEMMGSMREVVGSVQSVARRFGAIGGRAADLSTAVLGEIETPVLAAVAVSRGVKAGANHFLQRLVNRVLHSTTTTNGDTRHEYEQNRRS